LLTDETNAPPFPFPRLIPLCVDILLEEHKNLNHIKIIDFGEAIESEPSAKLTEISGTMAYVSSKDLVHGTEGWLLGVFRVPPQHFPSFFSADGS